MHTTASDGRCAPLDLVHRVAAAGLTTFAVTDHDTVAALPDVRVHAAAAGLAVVTGVELTAVHDGRDVHVLAYWFDERSEDLAVFLTEQRRRRTDRAERMGHALARAGAPIDLRPLLDDALARPGAAVGRPALARALVAAGHATSVQDAFDRLLGVGRPGYVPRGGVSPEEVADIVHQAGGVVSLAHPGVTNQDEQLARWARRGLDALEAFHSDHDAAEESRYLAAAEALGLAVSGGSDFHGDEPGSSRGQRRVLGRTTLPAERFARLRAAHEGRFA